MEITEKIIAPLGAREGVSKRTGKNWKSQGFLIETTEGQFPRHCVFRVFGEDRLRQFNIQVGQMLTVSFDIDAHEYQGRWFNDISAWRVQAAQAQAAAPSMTQAAAPQTDVPAPTVVPEEDPTDDLPF